MAAQDGVKRVRKIALNQCPKFAKYAMLNGCMSCLAICDGDVPAFGTQVRLAADPAHLHFFDADGQALRPVEVLSP